MEFTETELEELKEGKEGRDWIRILLSGGNDYLNTQNTFLTQRTLQFSLKEKVRSVISIRSTNTPLFIRYCCLKIHLA